MSNPENKERPNRSEAHRDRTVDRAKVAAGLGKAAVKDSIRKK